MARKKKKTYRYEIIQNDKEFVVANKPAGLLPVPIRNSRVESMQSMMQQRYGKGGQTIKAVHRIDRYTSGLMIFSKTANAHNTLVKQLKERNITRQYLAIVRGIPEPASRELEHYLKLIKEGFRNIVVSPNEEGAMQARLKYDVIEELYGGALLRIELESGLKNQIRVQLNEIGHPLIGDQHYNEKEQKEAWINRQALHAERLVFDHPSHPKQLDVQAPIPHDFKKQLNKMRQKP